MVDGYIYIRMPGGFQEEAPDGRIDLKREDEGREQIANRHKLEERGEMN